MFRKGQLVKIVAANGVVTGLDKVVKVRLYGEYLYLDQHTGYLWDQQGREMLAGKPRADGYEHHLEPYTKGELL